MARGELLTRLTVWLALVLAALGAGLLATGRRRAARLFWTLGCGFLLAHLLCAFGFYHHWSHAAAWRETARRTGEKVGLSWGGGLYLNYLLTLAWLAEVLWWWLAPAGYQRRSRLLAGLWYAFFLFMVFNATVVFGDRPVRWLGLGLCVTPVALWWRQRK